MIYYQYMPGLKIILLPFFLLLAMVTSLGSGLFIAALNVKFRDFKYIVPFIVQFGLYVSPIAFSSSEIYQSTRIPQAVKYLYSMNPMVGVIDGFRWCILNGSTPVFMPGFIISTIISFLFLVIGVWYFRKMEKTFADVI